MKKYQTIVIDFPWQITKGFNLTKKFKRYHLGYQSMSDEDILRFPIDDFASERCDLFLWSVTSKVPFCFELLKEWGFRYMEFMAWDKVNGVAVNGMNRIAEWIIYSYRGTMGLKRDGHIIPNLIREKKRGHSVKPDVFYEMLRINTHEPRIDIFARRRHFGFEAWGNEKEVVIQQLITIPVQESLK